MTVLAKEHAPSREGNQTKLDDEKEGETIQAESYQQGQKNLFKEDAVRLWIFIFGHVVPVRLVKS